MTKEELLLLQNALLTEISAEVDSIINKADVSPIFDKFNYAYVHGRAAGALQIMNTVSQFFMDEYERMVTKED